MTSCRTGGGILAEEQKKSNISVGVGFLLELGGRMLMALGGSGNNVPELAGGVVVTIAGIGLFIWGCVEYCKGKGQSPWLGLLGFLICIGLIILPDNYKNGAPPTRTGGFTGGPGVWPPPPLQP